VTVTELVAGKYHQPMVDYQGWVFPTHASKIPTDSITYGDNAVVREGHTTATTTALRNLTAVNQVRHQLFNAGCMRGCTGFATLINAAEFHEKIVWECHNGSCSIPVQ
jgi:hypothetical protein